MRTVMIRCRDEGEEEPEEMFFHIFLRAKRARKYGINIDEGDDEPERGIYPIIM